MNDSTTYSIYRIVCFPTAKIYVGLTLSPSKRKRDHFFNLKNKRHINKHMQSAFDKYGIESFYFEVIEKDIPAELAGHREQYWICFYDSYLNGFNATLGGELALSRYKPCVWEGINYKSITQCAHAINIPAARMSAWIAKGYTRFSDIPVRALKDKRPCTWNGIHYSGINQCAKANGFDSKSLANWIRLGFTSDAEVSLNIQKGIPVEWNGVLYDSYRNASKATGINEANIRRWARAGFKCDEDVKNNIIPTAVPIPVTWDGITYSSYTECADVLGITGTTLKSWIDKGYKSLSDIPDRGLAHQKSCEWNGVYYESVLEAANAIGVSLATMYNRRWRGYVCDADMKRKFLKGNTNGKANS